MYNFYFISISFEKNFYISDIIMYYNCYILYLHFFCLFVVGKIRDHKRVVKSRNSNDERRNEEWDFEGTRSGKCRWINFVEDNVLL